MIEMEKCPMECEKSECEFLEGNSIAFEVKKDDCEVRADLEVKINHCVRIWGRVKACEDEPVEGALVKLVKQVCRKGKTELIGVAHTITDCKGFYQFDICEKEKNAEFRVIVGKAAKGKERVIAGNGICKIECECDNKEKE